MNVSVESPPKVQMYSFWLDIDNTSGIILCNLSSWMCSHSCTLWLYSDCFTAQQASWCQWYIYVAGEEGIFCLGVQWGASCPSVGHCQARLCWSVGPSFLPSFLLPAYRCPFPSFLPYFRASFLPVFILTLFTPTLWNCCGGGVRFGFFDVMGQRGSCDVSADLLSWEMGKRNRRRVWRRTTGNFGTNF